jgi:hypothetical protein
MNEKVKVILDKLKKQIPPDEPYIEKLDTGLLADVTPGVSARDKS